METTPCRPQFPNDASLTGPSHPVVVVELLDPPEYDPMFGQWPLLDVPDDVEPLDVDVVEVVVAAKEAKPYASTAPTAKIARTAMSNKDRLLGNERILGVGVVPISIFLISTPTIARVTLRL